MDSILRDKSYIFAISIVKLAQFLQKEQKVKLNLHKVKLITLTSFTLALKRQMKRITDLIF